VGALGTLAAGTAFLALAPWGWLSGDPTATWVLGTLGTALALAALALAVPALAVGAGLRRGRPWARALALGVGVLLLPWVPIGTALGVATLVVLLDDASRAAFGDAPAPRDRSGA
jgi:hypothetical protein